MNNLSVIALLLSVFAIGLWIQTWASDRVESHQQECQMIFEEERVTDYIESCQDTEGYTDNVISIYNEADDDRNYYHGLASSAYRTGNVKLHYFCKRQRNTPMEKMRYCGWNPQTNKFSYMEAIY